MTPEEEGKKSLEHWPTTTPIAYGEVAAHLRNLASEVKSPEAREQFAALAALYERLAAQSKRFGDVYVLQVPPNPLPDA
jgi:hypothetical protein